MGCPHICIVFTNEWGDQTNFTCFINYLNLLIMKNLINQVQLVGHLGMDPEMVNFPSGSSLVKLRVATNESYKDRSGNFNEVTQWHTVSAWGKLAERMAKTLAKGQQVLISGKLENRTWEDNEGKKRYATQVKARDFALLQKRKSAKTETADKDDMPF